MAVLLFYYVVLDTLAGQLDDAQLIGLRGVVARHTANTRQFVPRGSIFPAQGSWLNGGDGVRDRSTVWVWVGVAVVIAGWRRGWVLGLIFLAALTMIGGGAQSLAVPADVGSRAAVDLGRQGWLHGQDVIDAAAQELAERYAPVVRIRTQTEPCGEGQAYLPTDIDAIMDNAGVALRGPWTTDDLIDVAPAAEDLRVGLSGYHLDFPGNALAPGCDYETWSREIDLGTEPVVYARVVGDSARPDEIALQYWFFYVFNDWNNNHEGDWEMIQLVFDASDATDALATAPSAVGYSQHSGGEQAVWGSDKLELVDETHPVVYPAEGSQANFFTAALHLGRSADTGVGCDDTTDPHTEFRPQVAVVPTDAYLDAYPWLGFEGRWGERQEAFFNGPTGPNMKSQWTAPIRWAEDTWRDDSVTVPLPAAVGPNVTNTFCGVVEGGSELLRRAVNNPAPTLVALVVLVGLVVTVLSRTRWIPDDPYPVAQRRTSGQILAVSRRMYARHWRLFVGVGLVYVPVSLVAVGAQWLLVQITRLDSLAGPDGDQNAWAVFVVVLLGQAISLLAYFCVLAAVTRALDDLGRGRTPSLAEAFGSVGRRLRPLAGVAARIVVVVGLLLLPVVTAPLALIYAVRHGLAVPAVLVENESVSGALRRSRRLVRGHWWRVALLVSLVVAIGAATGPLVGIGLVLVSDASFVIINLVAGLVYAVVIPFVALVLAYLYFDLAERAESNEPSMPVAVP